MSSEGCYAQLAHEGNCFTKILDSSQSHPTDMLIGKLWCCPPQNVSVYSDTVVILPRGGRIEYFQDFSIFSVNVGYTTYLQNMPWANAEQTCVSRGGHLATFKDVYEALYIMVILKFQDLCNHARLCTAFCSRHGVKLQSKT